MTKNSSVAPKERVNIKFVPATGDANEAVELPMKMVVLGDFTGRADETPLEERDAINVDKTSFEKVLGSMDLSCDIEVKNTLQEEDPDATLQSTLKFSSLQDFAPDSLLRQVPELSALADLREALTALKGPLGNMPAFRKALSELLENPEQRDALLKQLESPVSAQTDETKS